MAHLHDKISMLLLISTLNLASKKINIPKTKIITPPLIDHNIGVPPVIQVQFNIDSIILYCLLKR